MTFLPRIVASLLVSSFIVLTPRPILAQESSPTATPSETPTDTPTATAAPTDTPTMAPTTSPTVSPTAAASPSPTSAPAGTTTPTQTPEGVLGSASVLGGTSGPKGFLTWISAGAIGIIVILFGVRVAKKIYNGEE